MSEQVETKDSNSKWTGTRIFSIVAAIVTVLFAFQNLDAVDVSVLFWKFPISLAILLIGTLALGVFLFFIAIFPAKRKLSADLKFYKEEAERLQKQLDEELFQKKQQQMNEDIHTLGINAVQDKDTGSSTTSIS